MQIEGREFVRNLVIINQFVISLVYSYGSTPLYSHHQQSNETPSILSLILIL